MSWIFDLIDLARWYQSKGYDWATACDLAKADIEATAGPEREAKLVAG